MVNQFIREFLASNRIVKITKLNANDREHETFLFAECGDYQFEVELTRVEVRQLINELEELIK